MKKFIEKWLGLVTKEEFLATKEELSVTKEELSVTKTQFDNHRRDVATVYANMEQLQNEAIRRFEVNLSKIKPVLKIDDPEAEKEIKRMLSEFIRSVNLQQETIQGMVHTANSNRAVLENLLSDNLELHTKISNTVKSLGIIEPDTTDEIFTQAFVDTIRKIKADKLISSEVVEHE